MGIPFYFASLLKSHRGISRPVKQRMEVDVLGVDFNCLIHRYIDDANPIHSVVDAFAHIIEAFCHPKQLVIAMDGIVPYAKIVQQRYRRMRTPEHESPVFDRNQISPGTPYMKELESALQHRFPYAIMSGTLEEGEGEHKLIQKLRVMDASRRRSVCIYGLDADLILIALQHSGLAEHMSLLRESGEFNDPKLDVAEFSMLDIHSLKEQLPIPIDQYVAMSILCFGNDFMPALGMFSLREDGYQRALAMYEAAGKPDLTTYEGRNTFLDVAERKEFPTFQERIKLRRRPEEKGMFGRDGAHFERQYYLHVMDGVQSTKPVVDAFWTTFHWTLAYFLTSEPVNWDWVYPYPDAPLLRTLMAYEGEAKPVPAPRTYGIGDQLQFILPSKSCRLARRPVRFPNEVYAATRHPWMKRHEWEMKPRISLPWHPTAAASTEVSPL